MTRLEKCELLKNKGYKYNPETGKIYGIRGKEITCKKNGYINLVYNGYFKNLFAHHYAWYMTYGNVNFYELDHINRVRDDNRICNLRVVNKRQQAENRNSKGYTFRNDINKYQVRIVVDGIRKTLGYYKTEEEARQSYLLAKEKYHYTK